MANAHLHRHTQTACAECRLSTFEPRPALSSARSIASGACACEAFGVASTSGETAASAACETFDEVWASFWASGVRWVLAAQQEIAVRCASPSIGRTFWRGRTWMRSAVSWSCWSTSCGAAPVASRCREPRRARNLMSDVLADFDPQHTYQHCLATLGAAPSPPPR